MQPTRSSLEKIMWSVRIMVRSDRKTRMCRHTSDDQPSTRIACVLSRADRHDTPDNIADIVGDQQGAGLVDHHADRTPEGMPVLTDESGQYILRCTCRSSIGERHEHHLVRSEEHTSELQSLMRISYAVFCLKKKKTT